MSNIVLRPIHYACVSGGKDSLYMLNLILHNLNKYPLDCVVHYELEIDYPFVKDIIDYMEEECKKHNIPFYRIKPSKTWQELYEKYDFPTGRVRWCNSMYKMDGERQMQKWIKSMNCRPVAYIGFCADETKRFKYQIGQGEDQDVCYPLAEEGIVEDTILQGAKDIPMFNNWYKHLRRQGCMLCPMATRKEIAYMKIYYPDVYEKFMNYVDKYEKKFNTCFGNGKYNVEYMRNIIDTKGVPKILEELKGE